MYSGFLCQFLSKHKYLKVLFLKLPFQYLPRLCIQFPLKKDYLPLSMPVTILFQSISQMLKINHLEILFALNFSFDLAENIYLKSYLKSYFYYSHCFSIFLITYK